MNEISGMTIFINIGEIMMKKYLLMAAVLLMPLLVMAQTSGGQVKRPVKKQATTATIQTKKQASSKQTSSSAPSKRQIPTTTVSQNSSGSNIPPVLQRLINNMVRVEGGTFMRGGTSEKENVAYSEDYLAHRVTLSSFKIGKYEVTQEERQAVMGRSPSNFKGARRPVENVSWNDCQDFIRKLNAMTGKRFHLPTEAEWEYAARGGNHSKGYKYAGSDDMDIVTWYYNNSSSTHDVGLKYPNELGLYDMSGNVWERCQEWFGDYSKNSQTGPSHGTHRVIRGGGWENTAINCRSTTRSLNEPSNFNRDLGFRLAL